MGIGSYFKTSTANPAATPAPAPAKAPTPQPQMSEKPPSWNNGNSRVSEMDLQPPNFSRPQSISARSARSARSHQSSLFLDEIKHEVMVNYLYQQQCSQLWVSDGSGEVEGVLLRKARGLYMACPPQLGNSVFAQACASLNVQVRFVAKSTMRRY
jgi:hypothetical protein